MNNEQTPKNVADSSAAAAEKRVSASTPLTEVRERKIELTPEMKAALTLKRPLPSGRR